MSTPGNNTTDIHNEAVKNISLLFQNMTSGYALHEIICNTDSEPVDYRFLMVNPAFEKLTGLKSENLIGKTCLEALPGTEKYWIEAYGKVALTGEVLTFENYSSELNKYFLVTAYAPEYGKFVTLFADITERIEIEHKLVKAEENYRTIFNSVTEALFIQDSETGKLLDVNETMLSMYGYDSKEEVMCKSVDELSAVDEGFGPDEVKKVIHKILSEGQQTFEWRAKRKDGSKFWIDLNLKTVVVGNDKILLVTGRNIDKRKHAELELQRSEERYKSLFYDNEMVILLIDPVTGCIQDANPAAARFYGWSLEELRTMNVDQINTLPDEGIREKMCLVNEQKKNRFSFQHRLADGEIRDVEVSSGVITFGDKKLIYSLVNDVTDKMKAEKEILHLSNYFQSIIENANDGIVLVDVFNGGFKYASQSAKKMFGYSDADLQKKSPDDLTHPDDLPMVLLHLQKLLADASYVPVLEYRFLHASGSWIWIESTFSNLISNPDVQAVVINFRDITERKANELQQQTNKELLNKLLVDSSVYISSSAGDANFQKITNRILEISGAKFAVFNLFDEDGRGFTTKSFSGLSDFVQISMKYFGANFIDKKWPYDPHREKLIGGKTIAHFNSLFELVAEILPRQVTKVIEKVFNIDHLTVVSIKKDEIVLGDFTLVFEAEKHLKNEEIIHLFANQTGQYLQRLRAENVIRKSEQSYRYLFDNNPQPMFLFDVKTWKFLKVNFAAIQLYGYTNDEFMQMTLNDIRLPEDVDLFVDTLKNADRDYNFIEAVRHIKKSKEIIYVDIHTTKIIFDGKEARHVLINDITQSKIANEALHDKMNELVRFHNLTVDRELKMIELKKEINELLKKVGEEERYKIL